MSELLAENNVQVRERFVCNSDMKAEWCLSKIRKVKEDLKIKTDELDRQMKFYEDQKELVAQKAKEDVDFFTSILQEYFQSRKDAGFTRETDKKTMEIYDLPSGSLVMKRREPEYEYKKEKKKAVEFLEKNNLEAFVKTEKSVKWSDLKPFTKVVGNSVVMKETGEIVPGINVTERDDEFEVEVK